MKPLFEIPELLTLNGGTILGGIDAEAAIGHACSGGCVDGCCSGCDQGSGKGAAIEDPIE